jgi:hypothetical protein
MDAYDLYHEIQKVWVDNSSKNSGELYKKYQHMATVVWTPEGHREVIGVKWNSDIKSVELILDRD